MKIKRSRGRNRVFTVVLAGFAAGLISAAAWRTLLDNELVSAVYASQPKRVDALLNMGANPDTDYILRVDGDSAQGNSYTVSAPGFIEHAASLVLRRQLRRKEVNRRALVFLVFGVGRFDRSGDALNDSDTQSIMKSILRRGADVNSTDEFGQTPLMHAVWAHNLTMVDLLLKNGADATRTYGNPQWSMLDFASSSKSDSKIVSALRAHRATNVFFIK